MSGRLVAWIWVVGLLLLVGSPAHASEAPAPDPSVEVPGVVVLEPAPITSFDVTKYRKTRNTWRIGMALGVVGPAAFFGGALISLNACFLECNGDPTGGTVLAVLGGAATVTGMALAIGGAFGHVGVLRRGQLHVSNALALSSVLVPLALTALLVSIAAAGGGEVAGVMIGAAYASIFALSGAQLAHDASWVGPRRAALVVAPTWNGRSAGAAVSARW